MSQRHQQRTEPWPPGACKKICEDRTSDSRDMLVDADRQTDRHTHTPSQTDLNTPHPYMTA